MMRIASCGFVLLLALATPAFAQEEEATEFRERASLFVRHCTKCHTVGQGNRVGPDLKDVTTRRDREWLLGFITSPSDYLDTDPTAVQLLEEFDGVRMADLGLTRPEAEGLLEFIDTLGEGGLDFLGGFVALEEEARSAKVDLPDEGLGLSGVGVVLFGLGLVLTALLWKLGSPRTAQVVLVLSLGVGYWSFGGRRYHHVAGNDQGYEPVQPIAFSHALHSGSNGISCLYCHHGAEKGPVAGVPSVNICMNCHKVVRQRIDQEEPSPEIAKVVNAWESLGTADPRPIEWVRVHRLPDFVTFDHRVHLTGGVECQECHGPVEEMEVIRQASPLSMGWCLGCHRRRGRSAPAHWKRSEAPVDCSACHQ